MAKKSNEKKPYDLEERTFLFAKNVAIFCKNLPKTISNIEYLKQVVRASGSVGANYIEANEALGKKIFQCELKFPEKRQKRAHIG